MIGHKRVLFPLNRLIPALIPSRQYSNEDDEPIVFNRLNRCVVVTANTTID